MFSFNIDGLAAKYYIEKLIYLTLSSKTGNTENHV